MPEERECPTCYQEIAVYCPSSEDATAYFKEHEDLDGNVCAESDEIAPEED